MRNPFNRGFLPIYCLDDGGGDGGGGETGYVGVDGTFADGWTGREEFKANAETLGRFKSVPELAKGYMEARTKIGKDPNSLAEIPTETSSDEIKAAWGKANGKPDTVDGYEYNYSDDFAAKLGPIDETKMSAIKEFAHKELRMARMNGRQNRCRFSSFTEVR